MSRAPEFSIILAAGKGTRMRSSTLHKVCFPIDGQPAINRALAVYNACGIRRHIVVVGALAGQVMETVGSACDNAVFVYQPEQRGTAHAARIATRVFDEHHDEAAVLLAAGDRLIEPATVERLFDHFYRRRCDLALIATPAKPDSSQGRIVTAPDGRLLAIIEAPDARQRKLYRQLRAQAERGEIPDRATLVELLKTGFARQGQPPSERKLATAFGKLWELLQDEATPLSAAAIRAAIPEALTRFRVADGTGSARELTPEEVEALPLANNSVYLIKVAALRRALAGLTRNNAQGEEYLSDLVAVLASASGDGPRFRLEALRVDSPTAVMGYNDPAELLEVEALVKARGKREALAPLPGDQLRPIAGWLKLFAATRAARGGVAWRQLAALYGDDPEAILERIAAYEALLRHAATRLGETAPVLIVRSCGRLNVMGRHIDRQGGHCNLMTINRETLMAVRPRSDDTIRLFNLDRERFSDSEFSISGLLADLPWDDWMSLINSEKLARLIRTYGGHWSQYARAAILRLQKKFADTLLHGMDVVVSGNIPTGAGLSSSSSLVVGIAEATIAVNRLDTFPAQLIDLCGEGEWFVGTRGGSADHAAVKLGERGKVIKAAFFDFAIEDTVPFPEDHVMAICNSGIVSQKSSGAKDQFNHRITCYEVGFRLIRQRFPQYAPLLRRLRDVNARKLGVPLSWIYRILLHLPEQATRDELREMLPGEDLDPLFASHEPPEDGQYPIRGVVLFGLAECERARRYADLLKARDLAEIGRLMNLSHEGDRVARLMDRDEMRPYHAPISNSYLLGLIEDLESGDLDRVRRAQLSQQPGSYRCSLPEIDRMVDLARQAPGVVGAQLAGAGLGGCMMALVRRDAIAALERTLASRYYAPAGREPSVLVCKPIAGSCVLELAETA